MKDKSSVLKSEYRAERKLSWAFLGIAFLACFLSFSSFAKDNAEDLEFPIWARNYGFNTSVGFKDNILLSEINQESSIFFKNGVDFSVARLPLDGTQVQILLTGEDIRYVDSPSVNKEQLLIAYAQVMREFNPQWKSGLSLQYVYQDQVFDASITETNLSTVRPKGQTLRARPSVRHFFETNLWLDLELTLTRQYYEAPLDDFWEGGPKLTLGKNYGHRSEASLNYQFNYRPYDSRLQLTSGGVEIPGASLGFQQHAVEFSLKHNWDPKRRWQTLTRLGYLHNQDNGSGYFDYDKYYVSQQVRFSAKKWEARAQARLSHYAYAVQTVSSTDSRLRARDDLIFNVRIERNLKEWIKLYSEFEHERALSNRALEGYNVSTVSAGIELEF